MVSREHLGDIGWAGLATYVIAWDILMPETLSAAYDRYLDHKYMKWIAWGVGGLVTAHVFNLIPEEYDVLQKTSDWIGDKIREL